ncbi:MAG: hypothetical protein C0463_06050 [Idiomarina sp.]|nr:hypothetical protein [Idiomarina sp.]
MRNLYRLSWVIASWIALTACSGGIELDERYERSPSRTQAAAIAQDGSVAVVATSEHGLRLIDLESQQVRHNWQQDQDGIAQIVSVALSADNRVAVAASRETVAMWDVRDGSVLGYWRHEDSFITDVAVSNRGRHLVIARSDGVVLIFEPESGRRLEFFGHSERVNSVDVSANGRFVISGADDFTALVWRSDNAQVIQRFNEQGRVGRVRFKPDGSSALVASAQQATIWHLTRGEVLAELRYRARHRSFLSAAFSPDGDYLVTGSPSRHIEVWRTRDGERMYTVQTRGRDSEHPPRAAVLAVGFSPQGDAILSESSAGFGERWRLPNDAR